jgi:ribose transport system ATP-binding protein
MEIAAGLARRCELMIFDEPTAALTETETNLLFTQIDKLRSQGVGVIYISHRLEELKRIADRVSVLRDGRLIGTHSAADITTVALIREMVGREIGQVVERRHTSDGLAPREVALRVEGLQVGNVVKDVSFEARRGEILGLAGLMGSGRTETVRAIFGADRRDAGEIYLYGSEKPARIDSPIDAVRLGMALIPEDRKEQGLLLRQPIRHNVTLTRLIALSRHGVIKNGRERQTVEKLVKGLRIRCDSIDQPVAQLSGGNQQKVVIAKWLYREPEILIFDEPTRGVDVGAKFEIYRMLGELAEQGKALIIVSSELEELMAVCDRIDVMSAGRLVSTFDRGAWGRDEIMDAAFSRHAAASGRFANGESNVWE